jgi:hypothetical protein
MTGEARRYGPKMAALTEKQRNFVIAMIDHRFATGAALAQLAGYAGNDAALRVKGCQSRQDHRILDACAEEMESRMPGCGAMSMAALKKIVEDPLHKDHFKAVVALADRSGYSPVARQEIKVTHKDMTGDAMIARIKELALKHKLDTNFFLGLSRDPVLIDAKPEASQGAAQ